MIDIAVSQEFYPYWKTTSIFNELCQTRALLLRLLNFLNLIMLLL